MNDMYYHIIDLSKKYLKQLIYKKIPFYTKDNLKHYGDRVKVGDYTYGKVQIFSFGEKTNLVIGKFCSISEDVKIFLGEGNHRYDWITTYPFPILNKEWPEASKIEGHAATKEM
jgi:acetyltransferase-like isoleucine patch superfamily enzyme